MNDISSRAQYELDHDRPAYLQRLRALPRQPADVHGFQAAYRLAMAEGNLDAAERALKESGLTHLNPQRGIEVEPVSLQRAWIEMLRGRPEEAHKLADEAVAYLTTSRWNPRQQPFVDISIGQAQALAGRRDEALARARSALTTLKERDQLDYAIALPGVGRIYIALDMKDEVFERLTEMMRGPSQFGPEEIRHDPVWSRLKEDPRFDEILGSARTL